VQFLLRDITQTGELPRTIYKKIMVKYIFFSGKHLMKKTNTVIFILPLINVYFVSINQNKIKLRVEIFARFYLQIKNKC